MRRGVGIGAINKNKLHQEKLKEKATEISENEINQLTKQMETFKTNLQEFAFKYKEEIKRDSEFRKQFQDMCAHAGVDPLASSKGFFAEMLGVGDYYYELAVQIIEICNSMQERTGGLIYLDQIHERIQKVRSRFVSEVSLDDCRRAIKKLDIFGNAFTLIQMNNGRFMIQTLPDGMSNDHTSILKLAETSNGIVSKNLIQDELKWDLFRTESILNFMLKDGIIWVDVHNGKETFYFPSLFLSV